MKDRVAIIGMGYVGLPLAREASKSGLGVVGIDTNHEIVDSLNSATSHVDDISNDDLTEMINCGFIATSDASVISTVNTVVICVPTPLSPSGGPDLSAVRAATAMVSRYLKLGMLVILESTTYPGTTEDIVLPELCKSGLEVGADFHLAFSPERIDPGNSIYGPKNTPKIVGGVTKSCTEAACRFYDSFVDKTVPTKGAKEAEMAKLLENTYRHINIALLNEMVKFCHELDISLWDVISAAATKPFGFQAFYPGPGVGGHCIPIDPNYLSHTVKSNLGYPFRFVELAEEINSSMPRYVADRVQELLNNDSIPMRGSSALLLGVTYKEDIGDQRESPAVPIASILKDRGVITYYADPYVENWQNGPRETVKIKDYIEKSSEVDIVIILQAHSEFDLDAIASRAIRIFDTRGYLTGPNITQL